MQSQNGARTFWGERFWQSGDSLVYQTQRWGIKVNLSEVKVKNWYQIKEISDGDEDLKYRFLKLGIFPGARVMLKRKAPIFKDPLLIQVEESQFAITVSEAKNLEVEELCP